jgi:hypothetical protein
VNIFINGLLLHCTYIHTFLSVLVNMSSNQANVYSINQLLINTPRVKIVKMTDLILKLNKYVLKSPILVSKLYHALLIFEKHFKRLKCTVFILYKSSISIYFIFFLKHGSKE